MQKKYIWLDGTIVPWQEATIHIATHTLHYGSGAFEGIRCYATPQGPAIFRLTDHTTRLLTSFASFGINVPFSQATLEQAIIDTVKINGLDNCYIRPILFFGDESLLLNPKNLSVHCAIMVLEMHKYLGTKAIKVTISNIKRMHPESAPLHSKINGYYVNSIFAFQDAQKRGFDEALLLDHDNRIAEGSVANIFFVIDGILKTPTAETILPGITRDTVIILAQQLGIAVCEESIHLDDLSRATEAFFTGTASEITPIHMIDQHQYAIPGLITEKIKSMYTAIITGHATQDQKWLTFVQ